MITLHAGLHKTGSTAIQMRLAEGNVITNRSYRLWERPLEDSSDDPLNDAVAHRVRELAERRHVVLSDEGFFGSIRDAYSWLVPRSQQLNALYGDSDLRVVIYLRPHLAWARSAITQVIKFGDPTHPDRMAEELLVRPHFSWTRLVESLAEQVGPHRVTVRPYTASLDVAQDFFTYAGLGAISRAPRSSVYNASLDAVHAALMSAMNRHDHGYDIDFVRAVLESQSHRHRRGDATIVSPAIEERIWEHSIEDWERLLRVLPDTAAPDLEGFGHLAPRGRWHPAPHIAPCLTDDRVKSEFCRFETLAASWPRTLPQRARHHVRVWRTKDRNPSQILQDAGRRLIRRR